MPRSEFAGKFHWTL